MQVDENSTASLSHSLMLDQISLEQALVHISVLHAEKTRLVDLCSNQAAELLVYKARATLVDELEIKCANLSGSNKHLAL
jgi:hypothetical protein